MRFLRSIYHFLLFLIVSWTVYNTFIFCALMLLPTSNNEFVKLDVFNVWDFYLFGALDFHKFLWLLSDLREWLSPNAIREFWPFLLYIFLVNGLATYIWCSNQNLYSAWFLAMAPCLAGPFFILGLKGGWLLIPGMIGITVFYIILYNLNNYRKKHFPQWMLPAWLEWRRPNHCCPANF